MNELVENSALQEIDTLFNNVVRGFDDACKQKITDAYDYATQKHENMFRKNTKHDPYIVHPLRVALLVSDSFEADFKVPMENQCDAIAAALLHDVVEDCGRGNESKTKTLLDEISEKFGQNVASIVFEVTENKNEPQWRRKAKQYYLCHTLSNPAARVKMADKIDNCHDLILEPLTAWSSQKIRGYFIWSYCIVSKLSKCSPFLYNRLIKVLDTTYFDPHVCESVPCLPNASKEDMLKLMDDYYKTMVEDSGDLERFLVDYPEFVKKMMVVPTV